MNGGRGCGRWFGRGRGGGREGAFGIRWLPVALLFTLSACGGPALDGPPQPGDPVPELTEETLDGSPFSFAGLRGAPVLVNLWATWCAPCRAETPFLQEIHEAYGPRGLQVVGISMDGAGNRDGVEAFIEEFRVSYTMVHDEGAVSMDLFHVIGLPATFLLDSDGRFRLIRLGPVSETDEEFLSTLEELVS